MRELHARNRIFSSDLFLGKLAGLGDTFKKIAKQTMLQTGWSAFNACMVKCIVALGSEMWQDLKKYASFSPFL